MEVTRGERLHIGIFGKVNAGKSTLLNMLTGQEFSITSEVEGTTTDSVLKNMEIPGVGAATLIDTAGFDDKTELSSKRLEKTIDSLKKSDIIIWIETEKSEIPEIIKESKKPIIQILNKKNCSSFKNDDVLEIDAKNPAFKDAVLEQIRRKIPESFGQKSLTGNLCKEGDNVVLVMPQDIQAPKGRLILPQVQTIRELLDKKCLVHCCTKDNFLQILNSLKNPPELIITDSQVFKFVNDNKPESSKLTSFSILMAANKGDIELFKRGALEIDKLSSNSKVLIAEACTHSPLEEDIGRIKIPRILETKFPGIKIDFVRGSDFPKDLSDYDLVIHCGACMFNKSYVLARQEQCQNQKVPMTNYGLFLAQVNGIVPAL